ncbi:MAG: discoidin domain-containing protein, partial [Thiobacillus sp.]|nr:discoidin domain-containing protein [Thiobacillus sp.]
NLARGKPASQSSTSEWSRSNDAQGAVDGVINGGYGFHTGNQANPWWQVDLGGSARIDEVRIYNRQDCCGERARTLQVMLSDDGRQWRTAFRHGGTTFGGKDGNPLKVALAGAPARYVRLQLNEANWFHLDEVEVYGQMTGADVPAGGRDYTGYTPEPAGPAGPAQTPTGAKPVREDDAGPYQWNDATQVQTQRVHAGRAAFHSTGNNHFTHRLGLAGNYPGQYRYLDFWLWFDKPGADIQIQVQVDGNWGKRWGFEAGPSYDGYGWAMEGTTVNQPSGRWLHLRLDLIEQLHIAAGQAITGLAFSSDGADVWYDSVYLVPVESPLPAPAVRPSGKRVLEDDAGPYTWVDATVVQKDVVAYGQAAFRSDGNDHFTAELGVVGDYPEQFRSLSFWVFPIGAGADIQLQVQVDGQWGKRWGYEAGPKYDGYGWAMEGTSTGLKPGVWQELRIDLIRDLHINPGQRITGLAFSSDGADVYYDSVYLQPNPSPAVKPSFQPAGKRVLEDDAGGYHWAEATEVQSYLVFNGSRAFRSTGNNHFLADLGVAGNGAGQYRAIGFWAFFMGPAADLQLQVQVNGEWGKRWGYEAGPKYDGYGWAMEGTTANLPNGRWTWLRADLIDQLHLKPGDRITGLAFSSDGGDVAYDSVYLLPAGATPGMTGGSQGGTAIATGGREYTAQPGGRDYTGAPVQGQLLFEVGNIGGVGNGPSQATRFTLATPNYITLIRDYHWNSARGASPGTIAVRDGNGRTWGPWAASGSPGQGGIPNAYWTAHPNVVLPAGTYTVVDSDPASWSHNGESGGRGFVRVEGYPSGPGQVTTQPVTGNPEVDGLLDAVKSLKGLFGK